MAASKLLGQTRFCGDPIEGQLTRPYRRLAAGHIHRTVRGACGTLTHPEFSLYDFPKNVHSSVSRYWDGGENAYGAEPAGGRAKQHFSESADTKAEC